MLIKTPTELRKEIYQLIKSVNHNHHPIFINGKDTNNSAVMISLEDWNSIEETMYLESTGTMNKVREREIDKSGTTNIDDIDWNHLQMKISFEKDTPEDKADKQKKKQDQQSEKTSQTHNCQQDDENQPK
ncbi:TPA: type II toxin-antitoxin system Phd/YefM family antitoxin [Staphylococcus aureus]|nr:type II toxin-antitoxin system Phd/YefM family antitoxin [Staphylococcus aureus]